MRIRKSIRSLLRLERLLAIYGIIVICSLFLPWLRSDSGLKLLQLSIVADSSQEFGLIGSSILILIISGTIGIVLGLRISSHSSLREDVFQKLIILGAMGLSYFLVIFASYSSRLGDIYSLSGLGFWVSFLCCGTFFLSPYITLITKMPRYFRRKATIMEIHDQVTGFEAAGQRAIEDRDMQYIRMEDDTIPSVTQYQRGTMSIKFMAENIPNEGEDAEPFLRLQEDDYGAIGVFDGMGGAGSTTYTDLKSSKKRSSAFWGSLYVSNAVARHFDQTVQQYKQLNLENVNPQSFARNLKEYIQAFLSSNIVRLHIPETKLKGAGIRRLPTTMALVYFQKISAPSSVLQSPHQAIETTHQHQNTRQFLGYRYLTIWAGDSRCYVLRPSSGLHQLSVDDLLKPQDALENILEDSPMSNYVSFDGDYKLNVREYPETPWKPEIVLVASDGCFAYYPTPMHFEFNLVECLMYAANLKEWEQNLKQKLSDIAADDVSLALVALGFGEDFKALQSAFIKRYNYLNRTYIKPMNRYQQEIDKLKEQKHETQAAYENEIESLGQQVRDAVKNLDAFRKELWQKYRMEYERYPLSDFPSNYSPVNGEATPNSE